MNLYMHNYTSYNNNFQHIVQLKVMAIAFIEHLHFCTWLLLLVIIMLRLFPMLLTDIIKEGHRSIAIRYFKIRCRICGRNMLRNCVELADRKDRKNYNLYSTKYNYSTNS